jgi:hypothetical protein
MDPSPAKDQMDPAAKADLVESLQRVIANDSEFNDKELAHILDIVFTEQPAWHLVREFCPQPAWKLIQEVCPELVPPPVVPHPNAAITCLRNRIWPVKITEALKSAAWEKDKAAVAARAAEAIFEGRQAYLSFIRRGGLPPLHSNLKQHDSTSKRRCDDDAQEGPVAKRHCSGEDTISTRRRSNDDQDTLDSDGEYQLEILVDSEVYVLRARFKKAIELFSRDLTAEDIERQEWLQSPKWSAPEGGRSADERISFLEGRYRNFHFYFIRKVWGHDDAEIWKYDRSASLGERFKALRSIGSLLLSSMNMEIRKKEFSMKEAREAIAQAGFECIGNMKPWM